MAKDVPRRYSTGSSESKEPWVVEVPSGSGEAQARELQSLGKVQDSEDTDAEVSWRNLFAFTTKMDTPALILAGIMSIAAGLCKAALAIIFGKIFNAMTNFGSGSVNSKDTLHEISIWCIALTGLGVAIFFCEGGLLAAWIWFGERQAKNVRHQMFTAMLDKDMEWYDLREDGMGSFLIRIQTQIRELQIAISQPTGFLAFQFVATLGSLGIAFYCSWKLTLVIIAILPVAGLVLFFVTKNLGSAIEKQKRELSKASKYANTAVSGIDTVKAFNGQDHEVWQYRNTIQKVAIQYLKQARINALQFGITKFILIGIFVQGFWYGLYLVRQGLSPGNVLTTFYSCLSAIQALEIIFPQWLVLTKGASAGHTLKRIMEEIQDSGKAMNMGGLLKPDTCDGDIEINNMFFAYPSNKNQVVLDNATFFFPAGETTFLVGRSGSGKSTVGNILMRYYEPTSGEVLIDGNAIENLDTDWLRHNVTLVQQHSILFNETIRQNIAFGKRDGVTRDDIRNAAKTGCLEETINEMPEGFDTMVGSGGRSLSGGQTQRVAIARARIRDSPILILDESTSALDHRNRIKVINAIKEWRRGKTTIIITHDMSQIEDNDYVYVLENARVVQEGYKNKLAEKSHGTFASVLQVAKSHTNTTGNDQITVQEIKSVPKVEHPFAKLFRPFPQSPVAARMSSYVTHAIRAEDRCSSASISDSPSSPDYQDFSPALKCLPMPLTAPREAPPTPTSPSHNRSSDQVSPIINNYPMTPRPPSTFLDTPVINREKRVVRGIKGDVSGMLAPPASLVTIFRSVWPTLKPRERLVLLLGIVATVIAAAATPAFSFVLANLLSTFYLAENQLGTALKWALSLLAVAIVDGVTSFASHYAFEYAGQAWVDALRLESLRRILAQPKAWFDREEHSPHKLNDCLDRNAEEMRNLVGRFAVLVLTVALMLAIAVLWAFSISWSVTLVAVACAPVVYGVTWLFNKVSSTWEDRCNKASDTASSIFTETFASIRVVRALTLENWFRRKHRIATGDGYRVGLGRATYNGLLYGLTNTTVMFTVALMFYYGGVLITDGSRTVVQILTVINLLNLGIANASAMLSLVPQISASQTTATQMLYLSTMPLDASHEVLGRSRLATPFPVKMSDLSFTYASADEKTLEAINLTIKPGTCTAIVGASGGGKSTIASLLQGLYHPDHKRDPHDPLPLTFNGISILDCNFTSLRSFMSVVPQTPVLFPTSILENIIYGLREDSPFRSAAAVKSATQKAGIHDFIESLERGYSTPIGEGGMGLSGGQAQRVAIARALVRKPKLLILDEATSALDSTSAELIRKCIRNLVIEGVAVVMISHSADMMKIADRIVVVDSGHIVEVGTFDQLVAKRGAFSRLIGDVSAGKEERESVGLGILTNETMEPRNRASWIRS